MDYCKRCLYPDTKPDLTFDEKGVCNACNNFEKRKSINWDVRETEFHKLIDSIESESPYDCIIPVSGGKDSHYQIIKALEYGLNPLAVTATTDDLSQLGRRNLSNISKLGVDHIEITTNQKQRRLIANYALRLIGDISWAEHVTIFTIPIREAVIRNIPLVIWGENPQNEYGGPEAETPYMKPSWLQEFGGLNGLRISDVEKSLNISLPQYKMPDMKEIESRYGDSLPANASIGEMLPTNIFLGYYFPWDGKANAELAQKHGFEFYSQEVEGTGVHYENLDNHQTGIHDYFKYLKFGFGRATDIACNWIRRGYFTRDEGKEFVWLYDGKFPSTYLGKSLESILKNVGISVDEFMEICDKFTNKAIFEPRSKHSPRPRLHKRIMEIE